MGIRCPGRGAMVASWREKCRPSKVTSWPSHRPRMTRNASAWASTFSRGARTVRPKARNSALEPPPPTPRVSLPPDSRSSVSAILASTAGCRYGRPRTSVPRRMRSVAPAIHVSMVQVSYVGRVPARWSVTVTMSKPSDSACMASEAGSRSVDALMLSPNPRSGLIRRCSAGPSPSELRGGSRQRQDPAVAEHADLDLPPDQLAGHEPLEVSGAAHRLPVHVQDEVLGTEPGPVRRAAGDYLHHFHAGVPVDLAGDPRGEGPGASGDAQVGAAETALAHEGGHDLPCGGVPRPSRARADPRHGRVDAHHPAPAVGQGPAGVPRVQGGVGLDDVLHDPGGRALARGERPSQSADHTGGHRAGETHRVPHGHHELADPEP